MNVIKALIVEDNNSIALFQKEFIRQILRELDLPKANYTIEIEHTRQEEEAIRLIKKNNYCLIILDGNLLNGGHGKNVLHVIEQGIFQKIIVASMDEDFVEYCQKKNIRAYRKENFWEAKGASKEIIKVSLSQN